MAPLSFSSPLEFSARASVVESAAKSALHERSSSSDTLVLIRSGTGIHSMNSKSISKGCFPLLTDKSTGKLSIKLKIEHKGIFIVAVPLVLGSVFLLFLYCLLVQTEGEAQEEARANRAFQSIFTLSKELFSGLNALTAYSYSHNTAMRDRYLRSRTRIVSEYSALDELLKDKPQQLAQLQKAKKLETRALKLLDGLKDIFEQDDINLMEFMQIRGMREQMEALMEQFIEELHHLNDSVQHESGVTSTAALRWRNNAKLLLLVGFGGNILVSLGLVVLFSRAIAARLNVLTDNALRFAEGKEMLNPLPGDDEISELDKVLHRMAAVIEEANR